jgi:hypothetical protein
MIKAEKSYVRKGVIILRKLIIIIILMRNRRKFLMTVGKMLIKI